MELHDVVGLVSRWVHITSAVTLAGGVIFARHVESKLVARYSSSIAAAIAGLFVSGIYNFLNKGIPLPSGYHAVFGVKFLLALHVFSVAYLASRPGVEPAKCQRMLTGVVISAAVILGLSAYLRFITQC